MQENRRSILRDLALIYIAMAHSTDQDLSQSEVETISNCLRGWQMNASEKTVLSAIKDALEDYTQEKAHDGLREAVTRIRIELDHEHLKMIVDDLTEIALADDKFLYEEGSFIGGLARAWDVHLATEERSNGLWSVLGEPENGWSPLHDLALIYLELAHRVDHNLESSEVDAIALRLNEWLPGADEADVLLVVKQAMEAYVQGPDKRLLDDSVESLKKRVPEHQRTALLADLNYVARADGQVSEQEQAMIHRLARAWDIPEAEHDQVASPRNAAPAG